MKQPYDLEKAISAIRRWWIKSWLQYGGYEPTCSGVTALPVNERERTLENALLVAFQLGWDAGNWASENGFGWSPSDRKRAFRKAKP